MGKINEQESRLIQKHQATLSAAREAIMSRRSWSPFKDSPSSKIHGNEKPAAGKKCFEAQVGKKFNLDLPGIVEWHGEEVSPFTQRPLDIQYPVCDPEQLLTAAQQGSAKWGKAAPELRVAICLEIAKRMYERNFEMAHAVMHVAGQSYTQAFSGSGPNALDRGIEALAYASQAMENVIPNATYQRQFGREDIALQKAYTLVPRGIGLVICCASFPTWNAYPALFASLATGNPVVIKPHPIAVLPMAMVVETCREILVEFGYDPNLVTLAVDRKDAPIAGRYVDDPRVQIIDFTGSPKYGSYLENNVTKKLLYTETAGVNSVVIESVDSLQETARAIARATCLFSAQMCTSPQVVFVPKGGVQTAEGKVSFADVASQLVAQIDDIADNPATAAAIMGAVQGDISIEVVATAAATARQEGLRILREAKPYRHPDFPDARTMTPLVIVASSEHEHLYAEERFGPVLYIVATEDGDAAANQATHLAQTRGTISCYLYSTSDKFIDLWVDRYAYAGANLSINLTGAMWINFAAAYSDYHVTGLNAAGNACLADLAFVASRFRIAQNRRPSVEVM